MELRQLKHFLQISKCGSFSQAAKTLYISQPALTRSINVLEDMLQVRLFDRTPRGVHLTPAGEILFRHATLVLNQLDSAMRELTAAHEGEIGEVQVGVASFFTNLILDEAVANFTEANDKVRVSITVGLYEDLAQKLEDGVLDFVLSANPDTDGSLEFEPIYDIESNVVAAPSHPIFSKGDVTLEDLLECAWVMLEQPDMDSFMHVYFATENLPSPRSTVNTKSLEMLRSLIRTGRYVGFLPSHWAADDIRMGRLGIVNAPSTPVERKVGFVTRTGISATSVAVALMDAIREVSNARRKNAA